MPETNQLWPPTTVNRIIQTLLYRLAMHPLINNPPIWQQDGTPVRINKFRNYDGPEIKNFSGLTLSIFPYHYGKSDEASTLTVNSDNGAVTFREYSSSAGGADVSGKDEATINLVIRLDINGWSQDGEVDNEIIESQQTIFEFNYYEFLLRQYIDLLRSILSSYDMAKVPRFPDGQPLVTASFVNHFQYPTSNFTVKGNSVLHSASLLWQGKYYVPREWRTPPQWVLAMGNDGLVALGTIPAPAGDPLNKPVPIFYDAILNQYRNGDGVVVDRTTLNDPQTARPYGTLDSDLIALIDTAPRSPFDLSFYFKRMD